MQSFFGKTSVCVIEKARTVTRGLCAVTAVLMGEFHTVVRAMFEGLALLNPSHQAFLNSPSGY